MFLCHVYALLFYYFHNRVFSSFFFNLSGFLGEGIYETIYSLYVNFTSCLFTNSRVICYRFLLFLYFYDIRNYKYILL